MASDAATAFDKEQDMISAADKLSRPTGVDSSSAISTSRLRAANDDWQARHLPPRELLAWQQPAQPVHIALSEAPQRAAERTGGPSTTELAAMAADVYNDTAAPPPGYRVASSDDLARKRPRHRRDRQTPATPGRRAAP